VVSGANGNFYFLEGVDTLLGFNNSIADNTDVLIYGTSSGPNPLAANTVVIAPVDNGIIANLVLTPSTVNLGSPGTPAPMSNTDLATAVGSLSNPGILYSVTGNNVSLLPNTSFFVPSSTT